MEGLDLNYCGNKNMTSARTKCQKNFSAWVEYGMMRLGLGFGTHPSFRIKLSSV